MGTKRNKNATNIKIEIRDSVISRSNLGNILEESILEESKDDEDITLDSDKRLRAALPLLVLGCGCYGGAALGWTAGAAASSAVLLWLFSMYPLLILVGAGCLAAGWIRWKQ